MVYYIDIDGTLTQEDRKNAPLRPGATTLIRKLLDRGDDVVLWSANGRAYADAFWRKHAMFVGIRFPTPMSKPDVIVDDNPNIRPKHVLGRWTPEQLWDIVG